MDAVQLSYKRTRFFKELFDEVISLSFFNEGEGTVEEMKRIHMLGVILDNEITEESGLIEWYKKAHSNVYKWFDKKGKTEKELVANLNVEERHIFNNLTFCYMALQWWLNDENEPSDKFLDQYTGLWTQLEKEYGEYCYRKKSKNG